MPKRDVAGNDMSYNEDTGFTRLKILTRYIGKFNVIHKIADILYINMGVDKIF